MKPESMDVAKIATKFFYEVILSIVHYVFLQIYQQKDLAIKFLWFLEYLFFFFLKKKLMLGQQSNYCMWLSYTDIFSTKKIN